MRKKNEFRPDREQSSLLSKLYLTRQQRKTILKWTLYALALLVLSLLQDVILCRMDVFGASTDLVPVCILLISILEGPQKGSVFALAASVVYLFSTAAPGAYALVLLTFLGVLASIFCQAYLQKGFGTVGICTALALLLYELAVFAMGLFLGLTVPGRVVGFLITSALSWVSIPVLYPICAAISAMGGNTWKE